MKIKKIATVIAGALMVGATMGTAAAASYPDQILNKNVAVVYGTDGADATDMTAANAIQGALSSAASGLDMGTTVTGGESFMLDKTSTHMHVGDALNAVYTSLDKDEMDFLADGDYDDGDIDEGYEQEITLSSKTLSLFADNDYNDDEPTVGYRWTNGETILTYTMTFDDSINATEMATTSMPFLGASYYVVSANNETITLLDSADTTILGEGETVTVDGRTISIEFIDSNEVKLNVDGEVTDSMDEGETDELDDGAYLSVIDLTVQDYAEGVKKVEFSIGDGQIILNDGDEVIIGEDTDDDIDELYVNIGDSGADQIDSITITWKSDDETFLGEGEVITMPGLGVLGLEYAGTDADDAEEIVINNGETLTIQMGNYDFALAENYSGAVAAGEEDYPLILATQISNGTTPRGYDANYTGGLRLIENDRFIVTSVGTDLSDVETLYYEVKTVQNDSGTIEVFLDDMIGTNDITFDDLEENDRGVVTAQLVALNATGKVGVEAYVNFSTSDSGATIYYDRLVSDKGLIIDLPSDLGSIDQGTDSTLTLTEADDDDNLGAGAVFTVTVGVTDNDKLHATLSGSQDNVSKEETSTSDEYYGIVNSSLATEFETDESGDENDLTIMYYGTEVTADVSVVAGGSSTSEGEINAVAIADTAAAAGKNVVVVGGNCVNTVARTLLGLSGGEGCLEAFETKTGVGNGGVLIQSFDWEGDIALLVAGYSAADTTKAQKALAAAEDLDVSVGSKYVLEDTTAADASLIAA